MKTLILIGGGNMGGAMAKRWQATGSYAIHVIETDTIRRDALTAHGIATHIRLGDAPRGDIYILAIKPQQFTSYSSTLHAALGDANPLLVSIMAGIPLAALQSLSAHAVRTMPNLPALIGESMTVACAPGLPPTIQKEATELLGPIGAVAWVEEEAMLHAVTAISGSGPAYLFALMEALQQAATAQGLGPELARALVTQTMRGAALMADQPVADAAQLRRQVTSPGGTTEAALKAFAEGNLESLVLKAVTAAMARSKELAQ